MSDPRGTVEGMSDLARSPLDYCGAVAAHLALERAKQRLALARERAARWPREHDKCVRDAEFEVTRLQVLLDAELATVQP